MSRPRGAQKRRARRRKRRRAPRKRAMRKVPIDPVPQFVGENQKIGHSLDEGQPRHVAGPSYFDWRRCAAVIRDKPVVAVIWTWALLLSGCGGPTGKGMYKDRDRPLPEAEASPHDS